MSAAPQAVRETAYAKINLALHVRERMADGYHRLETVFAFAEDGDALLCEPADELVLAIGGPFADGLPVDGDNLVLCAAGALRAYLGVATGARLTLSKNLPVASGIGGGSADAAAALRGLARLWNFDIEGEKLISIAASLGADIPACLASQTCFGSGRGDRLQPIDAPELSGRPVLFVNPGVPVSTPDVFAGWDGRDRGALEWSDPLTLDHAWRNDLAAPAEAREPAVAATLDRLADIPEAEFVRMSGSGATCFALFTDDATCADVAEELRSERPDWWVLPSRLR